IRDPTVTGVQTCTLPILTSFSTAIARITEAIAVENDVITFGKVAFRVKEVSAPVARPQVVPSVSAEFTGAKPAGGTIVRQLPVRTEERRDGRCGTARAAP